MAIKTEVIRIPSEGLLRLPQVEAMIAHGHAKIYEMVKEGTFPAPLRLGGRSVRWDVAEVRQWIAERKMERDGSGKKQNKKER